MKTDKQLQQDVLDELTWDPSVDASKIGVAAKGGVVTLTGYVPSYAEKAAAERITKRVLGVNGVANDVEVKIPGVSARTDAEIAQAALNALQWNTAVPDDRIKVVVSKGWLTLEGQVDWNFQREAAKRAVSNLLGVKGVVNAVTVKPTARTSEVKSKIKAALHRSAELDANRIEIEAVDGKIVLHGKVRSYFEREEAERAAWMAPGVETVENDISIGM